MSKQLFNQVLADIQTALKINIETLAQEKGISNLVKSSLKKLSAVNEFKPQDEQRVYSEFIKYGPIEGLIDKDDVNEILINGPNQIWYETQGQMHQLEDQFYSNISFDNFVHRICQESQLKLDLAQPAQNAKWKQFRVHIIGPPLAKNICLSLRAHPTNPWSFKKLQEKHWSEEKGIKLIQGLVQSQKSLLIIGPTGSGKTSVLNACLSEIPPNERCLILEDTNEIALPNEVSVKLLSRHSEHEGLKDYHLSDLVYQSLRMRPDRIIVGEMRGGEAKDFLMSLSTGHYGGMSTLHAESPQQALLRLEMLIQLGAPQWNLRSIRSLIHLGLSHIICLGKNRTLQSVYKISSLEAHSLLLECLFSSTNLNRPIQNLKNHFVS